LYAVVAGDDPVTDTQQFRRDLAAFGQDLGSRGEAGRDTADRSQRFGNHRDRLVIRMSADTSAQGHQSSPKQRTDRKMTSPHSWDSRENHEMKRENAIARSDPTATRADGECCCPLQQILFSDRVPYGESGRMYRIATFCICPSFNPRLHAYRAKWSQAMRFAKQSGVEALPLVVGCNNPVSATDITL
jgi:hypothetical protein